MKSVQIAAVLFSLVTTASTFVNAESAGIVAGAEKTESHDSMSSSGGVVGGVVGGGGGIGGGGGGIGGGGGVGAASEAHGIGKSETNRVDPCLIDSALPGCIGVENK